MPPAKPGRPNTKMADGDGDGDENFKVRNKNEFDENSMEWTQASLKRSRPKEDNNKEK